MNFLVQPYKEWNTPIFSSMHHQQQHVAIIGVNVVCFGNEVGVKSTHIFTHMLHVVNLRVRM